MTLGCVARRCALAAGLVAALGAIAIPAGAAPIRITFGGVVSYVEDPAGQVTGIAPGTAMSATLIYDPTSLVPYYSGSVEGGVASYHLAPAPPASFAMQVGPWTIGVGPFGPELPGSGDGLEIDVFDRDYSSNDLVSWTTGISEISGFDVPLLAPGEGGLCCSRANLYLIDLDSTALPSTSLADVPFDPVLWELNAFSISLWLAPDGASEIFIDGTITGFAVQTVPEPTASAGVALAVLALGLGRLGAPHRR